MTEIIRHEITAGKLIKALLATGEARESLFAQAAETKKQEVGNIVYFRGLIEYSNICRKDCLYCGIRRSNVNLSRYILSDDEVLEAARFAYDNGYGSLVLQSGENSSARFIHQVTKLVREIKALSGNKLGVTLSCGEQTPETYRKWFEAGAHRYLLRIETSNPDLYEFIHPPDNQHSFKKRIACLQSLKEQGYQVGTGVMVGLPNQTYSDLADDLLFMKEFDIDMVGMGPYIEHQQTPLSRFNGELLPLKDRFDLTLKMIALLRILMPDNNIAAATAMQAIDKMGREKAVMAGANVIMPNITPGVFRNSYKLYDNKPCTDDVAEDCKSCLEMRVALTDHTIGYNQWGDSRHFNVRVNNL
ncbi:MAG: [FeFe] hydrogenase H-cluster radical SAM maturase HydE [Bacteroidetes bacterium]|jgi:biotin synthase|nr:[FeFe] hydrogenase H-cluster radical SAM maturase HydE [Bacteroidota bacterium]